MMTMPGFKLLARVLLLIGGAGFIAPEILTSPLMTAGVGPITVRFLIGVMSVISALYFIVKKVP